MGKKLVQLGEKHQDRKLRQYKMTREIVVTFATSDVMCTCLYMHHADMASKGVGVCGEFTSLIRVMRKRASHVPMCTMHVIVQNCFSII